LSVRRALLIAACLLAGALSLVVLGGSSTPLSRTCADELSVAACEGAVDAVMRRGLPSLHPLILAAHVEPGSAPGFADMGHRASVSFDLLGVPGATTIDLYYDAGGHWGGESDRPDDEIAAWTVAPLASAIIVGVVIVGLTWRRRPATG
jgi:hypothetical protein